MTSGKTLLSLDGMTKRYRHIRAVDNLSLEVRAGDFVGFIGPNGAGKTTTMRCIAGQLMPDEGTVTLSGVNVAQNPIEAKQHIGYVPQELELYKYLTGEEFLHFVGDVRGVPKELQKERITELLELTELSHARDRILREYSGGMARKIAIAAAILARPPILLLDESFVGLDPESTMALRQYLVRYCEEGNAVILSSHILDMLERICNRVVVIASGTLKMDLSRDELTQTLGSTYPTLNDLYMDVVHGQK